VGRHQRPDELSQRGGDPLVRHLRRPEGGGEERGIVGGGCQLALEQREGHPHLQRVLEHLEDLCLQRGGALVPEESAVGVEARVGQGHGAAGGLPTAHALAEPGGVAEAERLPVARGAGHPIVCGQARVVEEHPSQHRPGIRDPIPGRRIVGECHDAGRRGEEVAGHRRIGVGVSIWSAGKTRLAQGNAVVTAGDHQEQHD
jgi:hypothetical protein